MSTQQKTNLAAIIKNPKNQVTVENRPIPTPGPDELLIRNHAIAANPADWKIQAWTVYVTEYPNVLGSDVSGIIEAVGSSVTKFSVGDRVTGFAAVFYNQNIDHGAWQTYTLLREVATTNIPDTLSYEEASTFPMAYATVATAFYLLLDIPRTIGKVEPTNEALFVWGGASAVGAAAIQLANTLGYKVFTTASPKHHEYLQSLGAFATFDYHDAEVVSRVVRSVKVSAANLTLGLDAITEGDTFILSADILSATAGGAGKLALTLDWPETHAKPNDVEVLKTVAIRLGMDSQDVGAWFFNEFLKDALEKKYLVASPPIEIVDGGVAAAQKVFDQLKAGVSGKKLVVQVK
ncbi:putative Zinc-binding alcohol dehydrogenase domain-containing protein cipB [Sclerotinia borealis F-4128]|uniref:Putative Zinc-binding alcohol dehydrogenase domain-containing protein cipB n=1 Tax=Sclerotinia borealis (strain F-4128) TaxID=1432307 RepID=W9CAY1_SCLBF|nr:putative Zinc-binding alcohol dehydrogenase domain-containing protein cipB [Sclerotinia borealis F-4128]